MCSGCYRPLQLWTAIFCRSYTWFSSQNTTDRPLFSSMVRTLCVRSNASMKFIAWSTTQSSIPFASSASQRRVANPFKWCELVSLMVGYLFCLYCMLYHSIDCFKVMNSQEMPYVQSKAMIVYLCAATSSGSSKSHLTLARKNSSISSLLYIRKQVT